MSKINVVLISTYELGRQPFGLASPTAWLKDAGASVICLDLAVQGLDERSIAAADLVAFYVPMHTATRLATTVVERVKAINPTAHLCFYGLYAPVNEAYLRKLGAETILGGEFEEGLVALVERLALNSHSGHQDPQKEPVISLSRQQFLVPDRSGLPPLSRYAYLTRGPEDRRVVGYTEATRGCKHTCRHCPIVPVYGGRFRVVQRDVVLEDIRRQVEAGARHITFGDPDFFNGPGHAIPIVRALHERWPDLTYDVTIKIEHLLQHSQYLPVLQETGCTFVTSAVESVDDWILDIFDKRHTKEDFIKVVSLFRDVGLTMNPTFVTFTPWTSQKGYLDLLNLIVDLDIVDTISPIQYAIRLLIPAGSKLLELVIVREIIEEFDEVALCYPWTHPDPRVDQLYRAVLKTVKESQAGYESRRTIFSRVWKLAIEALGCSVNERLMLPEPSEGECHAPVPQLSEAWYC